MMATVSTNTDGINLARHISDRLLFSGSLIKVVKLMAFMMLTVVACVKPVLADDSQPLYVEITELDNSLGKNILSSPDSSMIMPAIDTVVNYRVQWRLPRRFTQENTPTVKMPSFCQQTFIPRKGGMNNRSLSQLPVQQLRYRCEQSLSGYSVEVGFSQYNPATSTLMKYKALNGEQHTRLLKPSESQWFIPQAETRTGVAKDYMVLGIQHILAGFDHLLFLLCLLLIAGSWSRVLVTITGFTVAHSLTLVLSALQWVHLALPPVEAIIALSIIFLATEIVKDNRKTLTWRYPVAVSSSFGLLHGFGFAAALSDIGLPQTELVTGLLFFNIGVEIGQLLFASAVLVLLYIVKRFIWPLIVASDINSTRWFNQSRLLCSYAIGALASFWFVERVSAFIA